MLTNESTYIEFIHDVLISIHENLRELNERKGFADSDEVKHIDGKIQAYQEVVAILKASAQSCGLPYKEMGL